MGLKSIIHLNITSVSKRVLGLSAYKSGVFLFLKSKCCYIKAYRLKKKK